jgi:hypothetical protein
LSEDLNDYQRFLRKARLQGWKDPSQVSELEIEAYKAGMLTEKRRVMAIFRDVSEGSPMRSMDLEKYISQVKNNAL